jgi:hypothetical protein
LQWIIIARDHDVTRLADVLLSVQVVEESRDVMDVYKGWKRPLSLLPSNLNSRSIILFNITTSQFLHHNEGFRSHDHSDGRRPGRWRSSCSRYFILFPILDTVP